MFQVSNRVPCDVFLKAFLLREEKTLISLSLWYIWCGGTIAVAIYLYMVSMYLFSFYVLLVSLSVVQQGGVAHEIRTPLHQVIGFAKLLGQTKLTQQQEYVKFLETSSHSLMTVINDVHDYTKLEAGKVKLERISI